MAAIFYDYKVFWHDSFFCLTVVGKDENEGSYKMRVKSFTPLKENTPESRFKELIPGLDDYSKFTKPEEQYYIRANEIDMYGSENMYSFEKKPDSDILNLRMVITKEEADTLKSGKCGIILEKDSGYYLYRGDELKKVNAKSK